MKAKCGSCGYEEEIKHCEQATVKTETGSKCQVCSAEVPNPSHCGKECVSAE